MIRSDLHVHSHHSFDGTAPIEAVAGAAAAAGLERVAIADHVELDPRYPFAGCFDPWAYAREIARARRPLGGRIEILPAAEVSYLPEREDAIRRFLAAGRYEVRIGSIHPIEGPDRRLYDVTEGASVRRLLERWGPEEAARRFLAATLAMARSGLFTVIGHLDGMKRFAPPEAAERLRALLPPDAFRPILEAAVARGAVPEVNASGLFHPCGEIYPSPEILEVYAEIGGRAAAFGSDAHRPAHVGRGREEVARVLDERGLRLEFA